ncbi:exported protein of unknown function [Limnospira indica PCC 8005]|uniref:Uncharacterized protein n=1 Tax=Limnospira indica PCC 8005 TaxID=376219 RepID=A0A9P1KHC2_9CYAN|nr:exported protein of unknown function [Limnospira indica PCC 8005]
MTRLSLLRLALNLTLASYIAIFMLTTKGWVDTPPNRAG